MKKTTEFSNINTFLIIFLLTTTPFINFLGKNYLQIELFTSTYFFFSIFYTLFFLFTAAFILFISKTFFSYILVLFLGYFSFLQFYFFDIRELILIFYNGPGLGYYPLAIILFASLFVALISRYSIFKNFIIIFLFLNIFVSAGKFFYSINLKKNLDITQIDNSSSYIIEKSAKLPNIFYIIPDTLASPKILKNYSNIDYKDTVKSLQDKGYYVSKHTYSSYSTTYLTLTALFSMSYPVTEKSNKYKNNLKFYPTIRDRNPELLKYLKKNKYDFTIVPPKFGDCPQSKEYRCLKPPGKNFILSIYQDYAVSELFNNSVIKKVLLVFRVYDRINVADIDNTIKTAMTHMKQNPQYWENDGVFTLIHMNIPHAPYREDNCSIINFKVTDKEGYKSSVYCALNLIHEFSDFVIKKYPNAVIIIQGDHGRSHDSKATHKNYKDISKSIIDQKLGIFSAVLGCDSKQAADLNQANIIKYVIQCLNDDIPEVKPINKSFMSFYSDEPEYGKVYLFKKN